MKIIANIGIKNSGLILDILFEEEPLKARIYYPNIKVASKEAWFSFYRAFTQSSYKVLDLGTQGKIVTAAGWTTFIAPISDDVSQEAMEVSVPNDEIETVMEKRIIGFFQREEPQP